MTLERDLGSTLVLHERLTVIEDVRDRSGRLGDAVARALGADVAIIKLADLRAAVSDQALLPEFRTPLQVVGFDPSIAAALLSSWHDLAGTVDSDEDDAEVNAAQDRVTRANEAVELANRNTGSDLFSPEVRRAIDTAHDRALGHDETAGRRKIDTGGRRRREHARVELKELLAGLGFSTYEDFVLTSASAAVDSRARERLREAVDEIEESQRELVKVMSDASARRSEREAARASLRARTERLLGAGVAALNLGDHELVERLEGIVSAPPEPEGTEPDPEAAPVNLAASFEEAKACLESVIGDRPVLVDHALRALPSDVVRRLLDWIAGRASSARVVVLSDQNVVKAWARRLDPTAGAYVPRPEASKTSGVGQGAVHPSPTEEWSST